MDMKGKFPNGFTALMEELAIGPTAMARELGTSKQNVDRWTEQSRKIPVDMAEKIAKKYGRLAAEIMLPPGTLGGIARVKVLSLVRAGKMSREDIQVAEIGTTVATGLPKGEWVAFQVEGDSMNRISPPGSIVLVNRRDKTLHHNMLYIISDSEGNATYKRYRQDPSRFEPVSTNDEHETIYPDENTIVFGRVRRTMLDT